MLWRVDLIRWLKLCRNWLKLHHKERSVLTVCASITSIKIYGPVEVCKVCFLYALKQWTSDQSGPRIIWIHARLARPYRHFISGGIAVWHVVIIPGALYPLAKGALYVLLLCNVTLFNLQSTSSRQSPRSKHSLLDMVKSWQRSVLLMCIFCCAVGCVWWCNVNVS